MHYDFDKISEREGTACVKYDLREMYFKRADVLPMWVADMDFETPDFIREAIIERASNPLYGYTFRDENYYSSIINWLERRHQWHVEKDWILFTPGVVPALNIAVLS
ncbi:MAG: cystathionine beta-lyase, partial [Bacteroidales bacterium]|nr:cystathionine beta-lyase [Bacteroidales bacterium]